MSRKLKETKDRVLLAGLGALAVAEQEKQLVKKRREVEKVTERPRRSPRSEFLIEKRVRKPVSFIKEGIEVIFSEKIERGRGHSPLEAFLPTAQEREEIGARQARRLAAARRAFLKEFGSLDQAAVDWERLQQKRRIFTVTHRGATYIPSFQFDEKGRPRPAVARVIQILGKDTSDWGLALWFTAASGRLDGKRPVDLLSSHPEDVVQAAEQEAAELVF